MKLLIVFISLTLLFSYVVSVPIVQKYRCDNLCSREFDVCSNVIQNQMEHYICIKNNVMCKVKCYRVRTNET